MTFWTLLLTPRADTDPESCGYGEGTPRCLWYQFMPGFFPLFKEHVEVSLVVVLAFFQPPNIKYQ